MKIEDKYTLTLIKRRYRQILLTGSLKNILVRLKRFDNFTMHIIRNYN